MSNIILDSAVDRNKSPDRANEYNYYDSSKYLLTFYSFSFQIMQQLRQRLQTRYQKIPGAKKARVKRKLFGQQCDRI